MDISDAWQDVVEQSIESVPGESESDKPTEGEDTETEEPSEGEAGNDDNSNRLNTDYSTCNRTPSTTRDNSRNG